MLRRVLLACCLVAFSISTIAGCSQSPSKEKSKQKTPPTVTSEK